ncbi:MAG: DUF5686 family protein, partial [Dysgonamonadaceae bacterium]|nr:DUF5686 family protein [Dysgonamonadaceae bacterium]
MSQKYITVFLVTLFCPFAEYAYSKDKNKDAFADSVMVEVFQRSELYGKYIVEYGACAYIKATTRIVSKNFLFRFAPDFLILDKKSDETFLESVADIHFRAPNTFTQKIIAINGTTQNTNEIYRKAMQFLNINVYNPTSFNNEILMPTAEKGFKYYRFFYDSDIDTMGYKILKIKVVPKIKSQKLISGYLYVVKHLWTIAGIEITGETNFLDFHVRTHFGLPEKDFLVPQTTEVNLHMKLLGNEIVNHYSSSYNYSFIKRYENESDRKKLSQNYDLSDHFNVNPDSLPVIRDSSFWAQNRTIPLTQEEIDIYRRHQEKTEINTDTFKIQSLPNWNFAKGIFTPKNFEYNSTQFHYSGLFNPLKVAYSKKDGIAYWQKLKLKREFESGKMISFNPDIGFVFKKKEIFFNTPLSYLFNPQKLGQIELSLGNRNQAYNSKIIDKINQTIPDSTDSDDLNLKYYRHYYSAMTIQHELFNGFLSKIGVDYHLYNPVKSGNQMRLKTEIKEDISDLIDEKYKSFTPTIGFRWTPKQYYRINEKRKEYLWSKYPTFSFEYARGIPGIFSSNSDYEQIEADIQQSISLGLLRSILYYAGVGLFTNTRSVYFADFKNFRRHNFPESWNDQIGGIFHLLDSYWYNASNSYIQLHAMYESPFVFLQLFKNVTKDIFKERFYVSQLYTPAVPCYTELGYGVGNYIFNLGVFAGFNKTKYESVGFKFAF